MSELCEKLNLYTYLNNTYTKNELLQILDLYTKN